MLSLQICSNHVDNFHWSCEPHFRNHLYYNKIKRFFFSQQDGCDPSRHHLSNLMLLMQFPENGYVIQNVSGKESQSWLGGIASTTNESNKVGMPRQGLNTGPQIPSPRHSAHGYAGRRPLMGNRTGIKEYCPAFHRKGMQVFFFLHFYAIFILNPGVYKKKIIDDGMKAGIGPEISCCVFIVLFLQIIIFRFALNSWVLAGKGLLCCLTQQDLAFFCIPNLLQKAPQEMCSPVTSVF